MFRVSATLCFVTFVTLVMSSCDKKESRSKAKSEEPDAPKGEIRDPGKDDGKGEGKARADSDAEEGKPGKAPLKAEAPAAPHPLPKLDPTSVAESLPAFVPVSAPLPLADVLTKAEKSSELLSKIIKDNESDPHLARHLMSSNNEDTVLSGFDMWKKMKDRDDFLPVFVSLLGNQSETVRYRVMENFPWSLETDGIKTLAPFARKVLSDTSCRLRHKALDWLMGRNNDLGVPKKEIFAGIDDACPLYQAKAIEGLVDVFKGASPETDIVEKITKHAAEHPFYYVRCKALQTLGKLKVKAAESLMAQALDVPAESGLIYYLDKTGNFSQQFSSWAMPVCATYAIRYLHDKAVDGKAIDIVKHWRTEMAKKQLASKVPERFCINHHDCDKSKKDVCLRFSCVSIVEAESHFWQHELLYRCSPPVRPGWNNSSLKIRVDAGLGLDGVALFNIQRFLQRKSFDEYRKKEEENNKKPCPED